MNIADELEKLNELRLSGALTQQEFESAKATLLAKDRPMAEMLKKILNVLSSDERIWGMVIHLSQFFGYMIPLAGMVVPIIMWQVMKHDSTIIDRHGRIVANWIITECILLILFYILSFFVIGLPLLFAILVLGIVFPIVGAIKAFQGKTWKYPCSISFFPVD
ncbi:MAG: DUF4870 domain-containing protein [Verrucomicrobiota bacterium]|nr:DUF4870 domain-containing protein [Verrucomicrobiota bacterium]